MSTIKTEIMSGLYRLVMMTMALGFALTFGGFLVGCDAIEAGLQNQSTTSDDSSNTTSSDDTASDDEVADASDESPDDETAGEDSSDTVEVASTGEESIPEPTVATLILDGEDYEVTVDYLAPDEGIAYYRMINGEMEVQLPSGATLSGFNGTLIEYAEDDDSDSTALKSKNFASSMISVCLEEAMWAYEDNAVGEEWFVLIDNGIVVLADRGQPELQDRDSRS